MHKIIGLALFTTLLFSTLKIHASSAMGKLQAAPDCTILTYPTPNMEVNDVSILEWSTVGNAAGYLLNVGTASRSHDILELEDVANTLSYQFKNRLPLGADIFVEIIPYNVFGNAKQCGESSFKTSLYPTPPGCALLTVPMDESTGVSRDTDVEMAFPGPHGEGWLLTIGTSPESGDILNKHDIGYTNTFDLPENLPPSTTIYVNIDYYRESGPAGCTAESTFTTTASKPDDLLPFAPYSNAPVGIALGLNGSLFVAEAYSGNIFNYSSEGDKEAFANTGAFNNAIAFDDEGNLYVADKGQDRIIKMDTSGNGTVFLSVSNGINGPIALHINEDGNLNVGQQDGSLLEISPALDTSVLATGLGQIQGIASDKSGNIYVTNTETSNLYKITTDSNVTVVISDVTNLGPLAMINQELYYSTRASEGEYQIVRYNPNENTFQNVARAEVDAIEGMAFNANGDLFVSYNDRIGIIPELGTPETLDITDIAITNTLFFPNPVKNQINFANEIQGYTIYDLNGKQVASKQLAGTSYSLDDLPEGLYIIVVRDGNGTFIEKLVKK